MFHKTVLILFFLYFALNEGIAAMDLEQNLYPNQILNPLYNKDSIFSLTEELRVDEFVQDSNASYLFSSERVKQWQNVRIGEDTYIIGVRERGISLISLYRRQKSMFQVNEFLVDLNENINCATLFKTWSEQKKMFEANVVVVMKSPSKAVHWYTIKNYKMVLVTKWIHNFEIKEIIHMGKMNNKNVISFLEYFEENSFLKMYAYSINKNTPHIWLLELLPLEKYTTSIAVTYNLLYTVLATVQSDTKGMTFYRYENNCFDNCKFQKYATGGTMNALKVKSFSANGGKFFAVDGLPSKLISVSNDGSLQQVAEFRGINQLMILKVPTNQDDVIILGKNISNVEVFTLSKLNNKWINRPAPPCLELGNEQTNTYQANLDQCLKELQWDGATFVVAGDNPTLIFPGDKVKIVHVMYSVRSTVPQPPLDLYWLTNLRQDFQGTWDKLHNGLNSLLNQRSKSNDDSNWKSLCEMTKELDKLVQLVHSSRAKLNELQCSQNEYNSSNEENEDITNRIIKYSDDEDELADRKGKDKSRILKELTVTSKFSRFPYHNKISSDMDDYPYENHENLTPLHTMIARMMNELDGVKIMK
ncbi:hypothetical protein O3M35_000482 [Rhynocoris fuscipes]|uniref:Sema domain-containing protein n=1 Tax=Rhynocoris fuscipes TaxID=488301 RepID=A0AAW1DNT4_9HEMI